MTPQLCLGTVQFGLPYGITNTAGQVPESEVAKLLAQLEEAGFHWLDTAQAYGNAEEVLGRNLPNSHQFSIVSKLPAQEQVAFTAEDQVEWNKEFCVSCKHLRVESIDTLLLHASSDLRKPGGTYLEDWLFGLRERGLVKRLGVSIYTADDLEGVDPDLLNVVQLPLSLFDQRLLQDGTVARLSAQGTAIHARSLYLQGLLLTPARSWPSWMGNEERGHQQALEDLAQERGCRLIDLALGFAKHQTDLEAIVLGVCCSRELNELRESWLNSSPWRESEWLPWGLQEPKVLDPRCWEQK